MAVCLFMAMIPMFRFALAGITHYALQPKRRMKSTVLLGLSDLMKSIRMSTDVKRRSSLRGRVLRGHALHERALHERARVDHELSLP